MKMMDASESYEPMPVGAVHPIFVSATPAPRHQMGCDADMDDDINNIEEWDSIGDSMDGAGRSPESYEDRPVSVGGILHAIRERHQVRSCAYCGNCIRENEVMYTRDDLVFFCDIGHDKEYMKRHRGQ